MDLGRLRSETRLDHEAAEASLPLMRMGLRRSEYVACLQRLHAVVATWEEAASAYRVASSSPLWLKAVLEPRRRRSMLVRDLEYFSQLNVENKRPQLPSLPNTSSLLGAMYVMEGSTLGGQLICRHVDGVLGLVDGRGSAYFRGYGNQTGVMWKEFCEVLKTRIPETEGDMAVAAAKAMFQTFGAWMQRSTP